MTQYFHYIAAAATEAKLPGERQNQDSVFSETWHDDKEMACGIFIVADGVGGHKEGSLASKMVIETISQLLQPIWKTMPDTVEEQIEYIKGHLYQAIVTAHRKILYYAQTNEIRMASTVTCAVTYGKTAVVANVGDSRTYLFRTGEVHQITTDHSVVAWLVREGKLSPEEAENHPYKNVIMHALGASEIPEIDLFYHELETDDVLLLCTDGVWGTLSDNQLLTYLENGSSVQAVADQIMTEAQDHSDDLTVILAHLIKK